MFSLGGPSPRSRGSEHDAALDKVRQMDSDGGISDGSDAGYSTSDEMLKMAVVVTPEKGMKPVDVTMQHEAAARVLKQKLALSASASPKRKEPETFNLAGAAVPLVPFDVSRLKKKKPSVEGGHEVLGR